MRDETTGPHQVVGCVNDFEACVLNEGPRSERRSSGEKPSSHSTDDRMSQFVLEEEIAIPGTRSSRQNPPMSDDTESAPSVPMKHGHSSLTKGSALLHRKRVLPMPQRMEVFGKRLQSRTSR